MMNITLGGVQLITPITWNESYSIVEATSTSEAGTDLVSVTRQNKLTVSASFQVTSRWYHKLYELSQMASLTLTKYDPLANTSTNRTVRMRDFSAELQQHSESVPDTTGVWSVSFSLIEF
ncbi:MAG: hypothetical protein IKU36_02545 [Bacteroidales bacterium]|nr:hypothetical protein [Bacteroidales bacterium]